MTGSPRVLEVIGEASAGWPFRGHLREATAVRVMTGALLPEGADAVVPLEAVAESEDSVTLAVLPEPGAHVRRCGEEVRKGEIMLNAGTVVNPVHIGMLASSGVRKVRVLPSPQVAILATGDELVDPREEPEEAQIRSSSSEMLAALVRLDGGLPEIAGIVPDRRKRLRKSIRQNLETDVLLITGGTSRGKYDLLGEVLEDAGVNILVRGVRIKPGRPLLFGICEGAMVFGLPGTPASTVVTYLTFVRPTLAALAGKRPARPGISAAVLSEDVPHAPGRRWFVPARVWRSGDDVHVQPLRNAGARHALWGANALLTVPEECAGLRAGETVEVQFLPGETLLS
jgi:molybdopterin molybdotransferase